MTRSLKSLALGLAVFGMIVPQQVLAAGPVTQTSDVRIAGGVLSGRVLNTAGQPTATTVAVFQGQKEIARTQSDANGVYRVQNLRSGVYTVATPASADSVRLWDGAAPAKSVNSLILTENVVRGNCGDDCCNNGCDGCGGGCGIGGGGIALGVIAVAAVATAIAVGVDDDDRVIVSP